MAPELVCRAVRLIIAGGLDGATEDELAAKLNLSGRHLRRLFVTHLGVSPDALARSARTHFARRLLDDTDLPITDIAFATGFGSPRQLNRACRQIFRATPSELRARRRNADRLVADGGLPLRLPLIGSIAWEPLVTYLAATAIPGVESVSADTYRRTIVVDGDPGVLELTAGGADHLRLVLHLPHWQALLHLVDRARRIALLDDEPLRHRRPLADDPLLRVGRPGRRELNLPGTWDGFETGVHALLAEDVGPEDAPSVLGRLVARFGTAVPGLGALGLSSTFPRPETLAVADLTEIGVDPAPTERIRSLARLVISGRIRLDHSVDGNELLSTLVAIDGVTPATAYYLVCRLGEHATEPAAARDSSRPTSRAPVSATRVAGIPA